VAEIESGPKTAPVPDTATVTADEKRREGDRLRKQKQRERERDQETAHIDNKPGGQPQPPKDKPSRNPFAGLRNSWAKKIGEPVGPTEARRQLWHIHVGVAPPLLLVGRRERDLLLKALTDRLAQAGADPDVGTPSARATAQTFIRADLIP